VVNPKACMSRSRRLIFVMALLAGLVAYWSILPRAWAEDDVYRAEFLLFERKVDPDSLIEKMANKAVPSLPTDGVNLRTDTGEAQHQSDLSLIDPKQLELYHAARRLERSGRYKVLMLAGWVDRFPPGYQSKPLLIRIGDPVADHYPTEGYIQIDRQRYLHVTANLTSLRFVQPQLEPLMTSQPTSSPLPQSLTDDEMPLLAPAARNNDQRVPQVITWMRETRRMRSKELHYLDSPTLGLLVYFEPVEASELPETLPPTSTSAPLASPAPTSAPAVSPSVGSGDATTSPASTGGPVKTTSAPEATTPQ